MKTILVDAVHTLVNNRGELFVELYDILEKFPNKKLIVTNAPEEKFPEFGLDTVPYEVFTLSKNPPKTNPEYFKKLLEEKNFEPDEVVYFEHNKEACESAKSVGITTYWYDCEEKDLEKLKKFLELNL